MLASVCLNLNETALRCFQHFRIIEITPAINPRMLNHSGKYTKITRKNFFIRATVNQIKNQLL